MAVAPTTLRGVTVVDTRDGSLAPDMDVTLTGDRITSVTHAGGEPTGTPVDVAGKYLVRHPARPAWVDHLVHKVDNVECSQPFLDGKDRKSDGSRIGRRATRTSAGPAHARAN